MLNISQFFTEWSVISFLTPLPKTQQQQNQHQQSVSVYSPTLTDGAQSHSNMSI